MKKIVSLFQRNYETDRLVRNEIVPGAEWVMEGEGFATVKRDGTCAMIRDGLLYRRYELKPNREAPEGFIPAQEPDPTTGEVPGWVRVTTTPNDRWFNEALAWGHDWLGRPLADGTYELCGPRVNGNPENLTSHRFIRHGIEKLPDCPRDFDAIKDYLDTYNFEGIVWWRSEDQDCDKVKIKGKDFGLKRDNSR